MSGGGSLAVVLQDGVSREEAHKGHAPRMMGGDQRPESLRDQRHRRVAVGGQMRKDVGEDLWQSLVSNGSLAARKRQNQPLGKSSRLSPSAWGSERLMTWNPRPCLEAWGVEAFSYS